ncbi:MAG: hypothetical protein V4617_15965 [Gemmatimonadota bacterium]
MNERLPALRREAFTFLRVAFFVAARVRIPAVSRTPVEQSKMPRRVPPPNDLKARHWLIREMAYSPHLKGIIHALACLAATVLAALHCA